VLPSPACGAKLGAKEEPSMRRYRCTVCDHIYDPAEGDPAAGIPPRTSFDSLPDDWCCPDCGASKADFEPMD
jgi:rubredoxin